MIMAALLTSVVAAAPAATAPPHLIMALTDDLGWNYPGYHNPEVITPTLDKLAAGGVRLESHYTYKYCSPTRAALLVGRMPYHLPNVRCNLIPSSSPEGTPLGYSMLPLVLAPAGYVSHAIGKWHQGLQTPEYTPVGRGFNNSYGFLQGGEDHWTHWCGASKATCGIWSPGWHGQGGGISRAGAWDLWSQSLDDFPGHPELGINGTYNDTETYSGFIFPKKVVDIVTKHAADAESPELAPPLFVYWAIHNTHAPIEAPQRFIDPYVSFADTKKETFSGMVSAVDEGVKNVTDALAHAGLWDRTIFVWTTDNGSPVQVGGSNHPLKGGKGTNWEGGIRTPTFVCGGFLGPANRGKELFGLVHVADWFAVFSRWARPDGSWRVDARAEQAGLPAVEAVDVWPYINGDVSVSPRSEIIHDHYMFTNASSQYECAGQDPFAVPGVPALGALRQGDWKLIVGPNKEATWYGAFSPNVSVPFDKTRGPVEQCLPACLYNIKTDPGEHVDQAAAQPAVVSRMLTRFKQLESAYHPRLVSPPTLKRAFCDAANAQKGFTAPYCQYAEPSSECQ